MMTLDTDILVSLVDTFLEPLGVSSDFDSDFYYDPEDELVYFSVLFTDRSDRLWKEYIKKTFSFEVDNIFMLSLLHEVGHHYTLNTFSRMRIKTAHQAKELINEELGKLDPSDPAYDVVYSNYFDLSIEKVATAWAIDYYKANKKRCDDFYSIFEKELHKQYKALGVKE